MITPSDLSYSEPGQNIRSIKPKNKGPEAAIIPSVLSCSEPRQNIQSFQTKIGSLSFDYIINYQLRNDWFIEKEVTARKKIKKMTGFDELIELNWKFKMSYAQFFARCPEAKYLIGYDSRIPPEEVKQKLIPMMSVIKLLDIYRKILKKSHDEEDLSIHLENYFKEKAEIEPYVEKIMEECETINELTDYRTAIVMTLHPEFEKNALKFFEKQVLFLECLRDLQMQNTGRFWLRTGIIGVIAYSVLYSGKMGL